ncbi:MAG: hypothetical protein ACXAE3_01995 [Candidatus Kariarchaeaceae archaeon]|jgi:hypothetical protein
MLMELYYIVAGVDVFHYSKKNLDADHFILSSGFLTALTNFSQEVRSAQIDFFSSETEIFMFEELGPDSILVLVFENTIDQQVARQVMRNVIQLMLDAGVMEVPPHLGFDRPIEVKLQKQIEAMSTSLISTEYQVVAAKQVLKKIPLDYLIIYDYSRDEVFLQHGKYKGLNKDEIFRVLRLLSKVLTPLVKSFNLGKNVSFLAVESYEYHLVIAKNGVNFTFAMDKDPEDFNYVNNVPFEILSLPGWSQFSEKYQSAVPVASWKIDGDKNVKIHRGEKSIDISPDAVFRAIDTVSRLCESFKLEEFNNFTIYSDEAAYIKLDQHFTAGYQILSVCRL